MAELGTKQNPLIVAVVGSGPSGFYAAEALLKSGLVVRVNLIEKLPAPFGLVRYGVAPDHPKLKTVSLLFHKIAQHPNLYYFGNVELGCDVTVEELKKTHHAVIFCNGAATDRQLGLPGEGLPGSHTATEFVAWYNGHPDYRGSEFDLTQEVAVVIGQGNVAADVCRILAKPVDELRNTDIAAHALEQLASSKVKEIHVVGRRGPAQVKFTSKELRELGEQTNCTASVDTTGFILDEIDEHELSDKSNDNALKCVRHFQRFANSIDNQSSRNIIFHFLLSPRELLGTDRLERICFDRNTLHGAAFSREANANGDSAEIDAGLCFRSIGYRGSPLWDVPFDTSRGTIYNHRGRVTDESGEVVRQLYTSGWIKRGPSGIIGTNRADSVETIATLLADIGQLSGISGVTETAFDRHIRDKNIAAIDYSQWQQIDSVETASGHDVGKPREKIVSIEKMLNVLSFQCIEPGRN